MGAAKVWNGDLQTPCGSAGEAHLYIEASCPALPHPSCLRGAKPAEREPMLFDTVQHRSPGSASVIRDRRYSFTAPVIDET
jgi:hypothetical protein